MTEPKPSSTQYLLLKTVAKALVENDTTTIVDIFPNRANRPNVTTVNTCLRRGWITRASDVDAESDVKRMPITLTPRGRNVLPDLHIAPIKLIDIEYHRAGGMNGDTKIHVMAPYRESARVRFRELGGVFRKPSRRWVFRGEHIDLVREALCEHYGHDDRVDRTVDVEITMAGNYMKGEDEQWFGGRRILNRRYRDSPPTLGEGVILVKGEFSSRGGSMQYPSIGNVDGIVLQIRHVPADHPDLMGGIDTITGLEVLKEHNLAADAVGQAGSVVGLVSLPGSVGETQIQVRESVVADYDLCLRIDKSTVTVDLSADAAAKLAEQIRSRLNLGMD